MNRKSQEWIATFSLTWFNPRALVTDVRFYIYRKFNMKVLGKSNIFFQMQYFKQSNIKIDVSLISED